MNILDPIRGHARARPDALAVLTPLTRLTRAELMGRVDGAARQLAAQGVRPGHRVGIALPDQLAHLVACLALARAGAAQLALPADNPPEFNRRAAQRLGLAAVIVGRAGDAVARLPSITLDGEDNAGPFADLPDPAGTGDETFLILQSSGTTGEPKFAELSHAMAMERLRRYQPYFGTTEDDLYWPAPRLDFVTAKNGVLHCLQAGAAVCLTAGRPITRELLGFLDSAGVTLACGTPSQLTQLVQASDGPGPSLLRLRAFEVRSATATEEMRAAFKSRVSPNLLVVYGTNEAGRIAVADAAAQAGLPDTVGRVAPGMSVELVDRDGEPVPAGEAGLVRVRGPGMVRGYLDDEAATARAFRDGWFHPGDVARFVGDALVFLGRGDDMMIFDGMNIYPAEIEGALREHPAVRDAAAFPLRHPRFQDVPVAAVTLRRPVPLEELMRHGVERLGIRRPQMIRIVDAFPTNAHGKTLTAELRKLFLDAAPSEAPASAKAGPAPLAAAPARPSQPARQIRLNFGLPPAPDAGAFAAWLAVLNPELAAPPQGPATSQAQVAGWLGQALLLARELLQVAGVPAFDPPAVLSCAPQVTNPAQWHAVVTMPAFENMPDKVYDLALGAALRAAVAMATRAPAVADREALFRSLLQEAIEPIRRLAGGGKSTIPLLREAHARGIPFRSLGAGIYQLGQGAKGRLFDRSATDRDSAIGVQLSQSKALSAQALRLAGLPAPVHHVVADAKAARAAAEHLGWPVVVKPADRDRGEGVSVDVDAARLEAAFVAAHRASPRKQVIVERQVEGVCHRLFIAGGRLLYATKRWPMGVHGDGKRSVAALVSDALAAQAALPPWRRSELRPIDDLARAAIAAAGLTEEAVPEPGRLVPLRRIETTEWGGVIEEVTAAVHPENARVAVAAAELLGLEVAGVDIISPDISRPWFANGAIINEVNFAPLLGGSEVSRRWLGGYLERLLEGDGRIPVEVVLGGDGAWPVALDRRRALGAGAFATGTDRTLDAEGRDIAMPVRGLHARARALLLSKAVHALVLVVQDTEFLQTGLPVDVVDAMLDAGGQLRRHGKPDEPAEPAQDAMLRRLLSGCLRHRSA
jgi:acyl-coenzyme A synthetase/AMP-(fatty) acid ligase/D-alanine-D-alanine ligase-like ATP-grasp enzyme